MGTFARRGYEIISKGSEYTVCLSAHYKVFVKNRDSWQDGKESDYAEEEAWDIVGKFLKYLDSKEYEIWGTDSVVKTDNGYNVTIRVDFTIYVVGFDPTESYDEALDMVDNLKLPDNVETELIEQTDEIEVGEPVYMVVGE